MVMVLTMVLDSVDADSVMDVMVSVIHVARVDHVVSDLSMGPAFVGGNLLHR